VGKEDGNMNNKMSEFSRSVQRTVDSYLTLFPDEIERLSLLNGLLKNPDVDLGQRTTIPEGHICASGIIVSSDYTKVLMLLHKSLRIWVVPGGHFDSTDVVPGNTALREASEETGLNNLKLHEWHGQQGIPLDIDTHAIPANPKKNEGAHVHYDFRYILLSEVDQVINIDPNESLEFQWVPLDKIDPKLSIAPAINKLPRIAESRGRSSS
jgi:8-oxo-dGTP pyrophosphatase MutT (NUDIX family)